METLLDFTSVGRSLVSLIVLHEFASTCSCLYTMTLKVEPLAPVHSPPLKQLKIKVSILFFSSSGAYEDVIGLFKNYKKLCDVLREKAGDAAGKKGRSSASSKVPQSLLSLRSVTDTLGEVFK